MHACMDCMQHTACHCMSFSPPPPPEPRSCLPGQPAASPLSRRFLPVSLWGYMRVSPFLPASPTLQSLLLPPPPQVPASQLATCGLRAQPHDRPGAAGQDPAWAAQRQTGSGEQGVCVCERVWGEKGTQPHGRPGAAGQDSARAAQRQARCGT